MALGLAARAEFSRLEVELRARNATPSLVPFQSPEVPRQRTELDCVQGQLPAFAIEQAARRARAIGVGADRVLIHNGLLTEEQYLRALATSLGVGFETFENVTGPHCPYRGERLIQAVAAGMLPLQSGRELIVVVAPRGDAVRGLAALFDGNPALAQRFRFTTEENLRRFVFQYGRDAIAARAAHALHRNWPRFSAAAPGSRASLVSIASLAAIALAAFFFGPGPVLLGFSVTLALVFVAWMVLRLAGAMVGWPRRRPQARLADRDLPVYSIIAPLFREAAAAQGLIAALGSLDYPPERLDIKLVIEPNDLATKAMLEATELGPSFEVIVAPAGGPRTKPKALNVALPFVRGAYVAVYDAEDRPEPDQLRRALDAFLSDEQGNLACVQARLSIDNTADNWLTALFTAEYAGQFDVFLPALAALQMPLPLGGSSNHFRTSTLRRIGAWDPYNVTEDADLGMRIARFGLRADVIESTTYEEAPARLGSWLRQRTRWFKGWMQTWLVHMREPRRLLREMGLPGFVVFQLMVGGNVLAALVHPLFIGWVAIVVARGEPIWHSRGVAALFAVSVASGYLTSALLGGVGLFRRRLLLEAGWALLLTPVHWLLLSLAAWRALYHLIASPHRWEKTEHGCARTSRVAREIAVHGLLVQWLRRARNSAAV
jgi:cellulose synthase/poly-beta-1,6-N-acetylglucosamine synthase-like glycosyltransferase